MNLSTERLEVKPKRATSLVSHAFQAQRTMKRVAAKTSPFPDILSPGSHAILRQPAQGWAGDRSQKERGLEERRRALSTGLVRVELPGNRLREDLHARPITGIGPGGMYYSIGSRR
jgi:hypothetical protein